LIITNRPSFESSFQPVVAIVRDQPSNITNRKSARDFHRFRRSNEKLPIDKPSPTKKNAQQKEIPLLEPIAHPPPCSGRVGGLQE
jgi:hypothetical protein